MTFRNLGELVRYPQIADHANGFAMSQQTLNAVNEGFFVIGQIALEGGPGAGAKTISSSGGGVVWSPDANTFADAGTTLRLGIQDLSAGSATGDGTWDAYGDLTGGVDTITSGALTTTAIDTGSKSVSHGDWVAVGIQLFAYGGADTVDITYCSSGMDNTPHPGLRSVSTTSTWSTPNGMPFLGLVFDDGTHGYFPRSVVISSSVSTSVNVNTGTADEYGNIIIPEVDMIVSGVEFNGTATSSTDPEVIIYSDPLGTPAVMESTLLDASRTAHAGLVSILFANEVLLRAGTTYAMTVRPTLTSNMTLYSARVSESAGHWAFNGGFGESIYAVRRLDNTGAFSDWGVDVAKGDRMNMALLVEKFNVAAGRAASHIEI